MTDHLEIRSLSGGFGAQIVDFDFTRHSDTRPSRKLGTGTEPIISWHAALDTHALLLFRGAGLDADTHLSLLESLGPVLIENEAGRAYQFVSNTRDDGILGNERFSFHSDHAFMEDPIDVISLSAIDVPKTGTQTHFVSGVRAAEALPAELRERIRNLRARHIIDPGAKSGNVAVRGPRLADDLPHATHPILWKHPRTGEEILYVSEQQTDRVESLDDDESRKLIEALFEHLYSKRFCYVHEWQPGDLVIWDNRALQHARSGIPAGTSRTLRRVSVGGTPVYEYFRTHSKQAHG